VDEFLFKSTDLGDLYKLQITCNDSGLAADWHLEQIIVKDDKRKTSTVFPFDNWINKKNGLQQVCIRCTVMG
jgi:hypothetical protein